MVEHKCNDEGERKITRRQSLYTNSSMAIAISKRGIPTGTSGMAKERADKGPKGGQTGKWPQTEENKGKRMS